VSPFLRVVGVGVVTAAVVGVTGWSIERARFGPTDETALARVGDELRRRLDASADTLGAVATRVAAARDVMRAAPRDQAAHKSLFDAVDAALPDADAGRIGVTVYDPTGAPLAWAGRVWDVPGARIGGPPSLFVAQGAFGLRLVLVEPVVDAARPAAQRPATIVVEQLLGSSSSTPELGDAFALQTSLVRVTLRARVGGAPPDAAPFTFPLSVRGGPPLIEATVTPADLSAAKAEWERNTLAATLGVLGTTLLLCAGLLVERRRRASSRAAFVGSTAAIGATLIGGFVLFSLAARPLTEGTSAASPAGLLLAGLTGGALVWLVLDLVERRRVSRPRMLMANGRGGGGARVVGVHLAAGAVATALLAGYERVLQGVVAQTSLDVLNFSLHPAGVNRLATAFALILLNATIVWLAVGVLRAGAVLARAATEARAYAAAGLAAGVVTTTALVWRLAPSVPAPALLAAVAAALAGALVLGRLGGRIRRASQTARLAVLFLALVAPAIAMYPSLLAHASAAKERLVADTYGPQASSQREDIQHRLQEAVDQIDALPSLAPFVQSSTLSTPTTDRAFVVWSRTALSTYRLTSAVELYGADASLVSRFSNLPEYAPASYRATGCAWEQVFDEVSPFGSSERHVLRTGRGICDRGRMVGSVLIRVMLDYRALPFISLQSPYLESLRPNRQAPPEGFSGRDIEFVVYGWSRAPTFESGTRVWTLPDEVFERLVNSRDPFWATIDRDGQRFRVRFLNDRGGIYALGYPAMTWFGHVTNLAELMLLAGVLYGALLIAATLFAALTMRTRASGRSLLREFRSSFYRKLFLAFVAVAVVPVVILAAATRTYFAARLRAGAEDAAARTVTTAQRLVEDYATLQSRGSGALGAIDDQIMVLVRRAIDEDVNLFDRARLQATSARDLFASRLLSDRTPGDVYRMILLNRAPTFVGDENVGESRYRLAAAPVRAGAREGIVTVPLANRTQEIDEQIDELDRRVLSAAVLFSLMGAALGYWMAERIADPLNRLTRATRRIARGDLDARTAATSSDELGRLVTDFNQMAADLKRQRTELERTQRLEAWADMARQVAHDIKNPLTPIQLSAEHVRRVNIDRGRPLSPALDECVNAILGQVRLLRQISTEFSSFASSPTPHPEPTAVPTLVEEVVEPYRTGLSGRIEIRVSAAEDLPDVNLDRTLFARALTNVMENALHAMPGNGRLTIASRQTAAEGRPSLVVEVTDTGIGMDREALDKLFEPYFSTKATGTGLGLTIARRNVELNGGTVTVHSERGVGTTVTMTLPLGPAAGG
jgi:signal transduction histidine kinase